MFFFTKLKIKNLKLKKTKAFTLVEVLVAISILIIGILSGLILVTRALYNVAIVKDRLTASFLAQEGIELTREIRDSNFLRILNGESIIWNDGLGDGSYFVKSNIEGEQPIQLVSIDPSEIPNLFYDEGLKIYNYSDGESTNFNREIRITNIASNNEIRVESIMKWRTKNIDFNLTVEDHLFNWMEL
jgi:type II secretory pathway pseudopilin PulG